MPPHWTGKYERRLQSIMRTLKYMDLKSLRKGILGYLTSQIPVSLFACFCLLVCFFVLSCASLQYKRIEIRSLCHMHQACRKFFFVLFAGEGGGTIQRQDEPKVRQGHFRGKWGYDPWEIL